MARVKEDSWVIRRRDLNRNYGRVEFIDGDFASVTWGWRVGGNFGGIESIDNLVVVAPPEQVCVLINIRNKVKNLRMMPLLCKSCVLFIKRFMGKQNNCNILSSQRRF
jgi:hypothetical protein